MIGYLRETLIEILFTKEELDNKRLTGIIRTPGKIKDISLLTIKLDQKSTEIHNSSSYKLSISRKDTKKLIYWNSIYFVTQGYTVIIHEPFEKEENDSDID